jgi:hypothetical protein
VEPREHFAPAALPRFTDISVWSTDNGFVHKPVHLDEVLVPGHTYALALAISDVRCRIDVDGNLATS